MYILLCPEAFQCRKTAKNAFLVTNETILKLCSHFLRARDNFHATFISQLTEPTLQRRRSKHFSNQWECYSKTRKNHKKGWENLFFEVEQNSLEARYLVRLTKIPPNLRVDSLHQPQNSLFWPHLKSEFKDQSHSAEISNSGYFIMSIDLTKLWWEHGMDKKFGLPLISGYNNLRLKMNHFWLCNGIGIGYVNICCLGSSELAL